MDSFAQSFGRAATTQAQAAGRVNLIGEHTDYNGGFVLPTLIPQHTRIQLAPRPDRIVRASSASMGHETITFVLGAEAPRHDWLDYVQGVTHTLRSAGHTLMGFDVLIESNVPVGSG